MQHSDVSAATDVASWELCCRTSQPEDCVELLLSVGLFIVVSEKKLKCFPERKCGFGASVPLVGVLLLLLLLLVLFVVKLNAEVRLRDTALRVLSAIRHLAGSWPYVVTHTHQSSAAPS